MREFQEKHQFRKRIYSKTTLFILLVIIILMARGIYNVYSKDKLSQDELTRVQNEQGQLQTRDTTIEQDSQKLKTPEGVEEEIRGKFDVAKQGEGVIVVVDNTPAQTEQDNRSIVTKIWDSIMNVFKKK